MESTSPRRALTVLIYEASCSLTSYLCYFLLHENYNKNGQTFKMIFLETSEERFETAQKNCTIVENFGSKLLEDVLITKDPKVAFKDIDYAILLPFELFDAPMVDSKLCNDHVDITNACYENVDEVTPRNEPSAVEIVEPKDIHCESLVSFKSNDECGKSISAEQSNNKSLDQTEFTSFVHNFGSEAWKQECQFDSEFHCSDIKPIQNNFQCYSYTYWDVQCPEASYKSKYYALNENTKSTQDAHSGIDGEDVTNTTCSQENTTRKLSDLLQDDVWSKSSLIGAVKDLKHENDIATVSYAIFSHIQQLLHDSDEPLSMIVCSDGSYNVHENIYFSFPVKTSNGKCVIERDICMDSITQRYIRKKSSTLMRFMDTLLLKRKQYDHIYEVINSIEDADDSQDDDESSDYSYISGLKMTS